MIPERLARAIDATVGRCLEAELGARELRLTAERLGAADREAAERGTRLLAAVVHRCYPVTREAGESVALEFQSERDAARLASALAFGAAAAAVLAPTAHRREEPPDSIELLPAIFNLGIGLVDALCDGDRATGGRLLALLGGRDLAGAAEERRQRAWLRAAVPPQIAVDPAVAFTVDVVEAFFDTLHEVYPGRTWARLRRRVGALLGDALEAERGSVEPSAGASHEQLVECSRRTSVLPFQIIETLAAGGGSCAEPTAGALLGEAMWRIDDLVDLCDDARRGALNGVLIAAMEPPARLDRERDVVAALQRLLASAALPRAAAAAADSLLAGLRLAGAAHDPRAGAFLGFIQRYAGIAAAPS